MKILRASPREVLGSLSSYQTWGPFLFWSILPASAKGKGDGRRGGPWICVAMKSSDDSSQSMRPLKSGVGCLCHRQCNRPRGVPDHWGLLLPAMILPVPTGIPSLPDNLEGPASGGLQVYTYRVLYLVYIWTPTTRFSFFVFNVYFYLFIRPHRVLAVVCGIFLTVASGIFSCGMQTLSWGVWDLVPWWGTVPGPPALGVWNLSHWTV